MIRQLLAVLAFAATVALAAPAPALSVQDGANGESAEGEANRGGRGPRGAGRRGKADPKERGKAGRGGKGARSSEGRPADSKGARTAKGRERWKSLSPAERDELQKRYAKLKSLDPEAREALVERAQRLSQEIESTLRSLEPARRAEIEAMPSAERAKVLRALIAERARSTAARMRDRMSPEDRAALDAAGPDERRELMRGFRERERSGSVDQIIRIGGELGLPRRDLARLRNAGEDERKAAIVEILRKHLTRHVSKHGLPEGVDDKTWARVASLDDAGFTRAFLRLRARHPEFGIAPERWEGRMRRKGAMAERMESFAMPTARDRTRRPGARENELRRAALLRRRGQVEGFLGKRGGLSEEQLERVRALDDEDFHRLHRATVLWLRRGLDPKERTERWLKAERK